MVGLSTVGILAFAVCLFGLIETIRYHKATKWWAWASGMGAGIILIVVRLLISK